MDFIIGCNYWASNAGTEMWRQWDENVIRDDFKILSSHGVKYLRVFPNWRDFQPVMPVYETGGKLVGYKLEGDREPENPYYLDEVMMERFSVFCDIAEEYGLKFIVGLVTGGMSGRQFIPSALYGLDVCTDSFALTLQQKLVKGIVTRFKDKKAIYAWDLGNECNCMCGEKGRYAALTWTGIIVNAIKACDQSRPVVSGMHFLSPEKDSWLIQDQAEYCDILTTHPYPFWATHTYKDYAASFRTVMYPTCETKYFGDIGKKPCFVEEVGTMGPTVVNEEFAADFMRLNLFSTWATGSNGVMWWCANEQMHLMTDPYTRVLVENELGMIDSDRNPKPVLLETKKIAKVLANFDFELPKAKEDAICIVTRNQDQWAAAYMTYCLSKQADLNIGYAYSELEIPEADTYILPSIFGTEVMDKNKLLLLEERVRNGATLYVSIDTGIIPKFKDLFGMKVIDSGHFDEKLTLKLDDKEIPFSRDLRYALEPAGAEVIAKDSLGLPAISKYGYGNGTVYLVNFPLETMLIGQNNAFDGDFCEIYKTIFADKINSHEVVTDNKYVSVTLHPDTDGNVYCIAINYTADEQKLDLKIKDGYNIDKVYYGDTDTLKPFDAVVFRIKK